MPEEEGVKYSAINLTLALQADTIVDLAVGFAQVNRSAAEETIYAIEQRIARDLSKRAADSQARGLGTEGFAQVASFMSEVITEAKEKMAQADKPN